MSDAPSDRRTEYLTAKQLAEVLQVSESTIHRLRRSGRIPAVYVTGRLARFILKDVRRALARTADRAPAPEAAEHDDGLQMGFADVFESFEVGEAVEDGRH